MAASCLQPYTATRMLCWPLLYTRYSESRQPSASALLGLENTLAPRTLSAKDELRLSLDYGQCLAS